MQDASYCRLKNLTVGYDFPKSWLSFLHVAKAGVYFSAENLFEFTNVKGAYDPEAAGKNGTMVYPFQRTYSFGLNVTSKFSRQDEKNNIKYSSFSGCIIDVCFL